MYLECAGKILTLLYYFCELLLKIFLQMSQIQFRNNKNSKSVIYKFVPFCYEQVIPNAECKLPYPRSGHRIGADSSNIYSFGGYNPWMRCDTDATLQEFSSYPLFQELWKFNFASKRWKKYPNSCSLPKELASSALLLQGNMLMVFGGTGSPFGVTCSNRLHVCKINEESGAMVEVQTKGEFPMPLYGQALVYHNRYIYTIGGTTGVSFTCDIHRLNLDSLEWEKIYLCNSQGDYEPKGRYRHEVGFDGNKIYLLGGGTNDEAYGFRFIPSFDLTKKEWFKQKTKRDVNRGYPAARRCHGAVQINTQTEVQVFITGGHDNYQIFGDLWKLDLMSYQWTFIPTCQLPNPTFFHATAITPHGRLYVFGGNYTSGNEIQRSNDIFSAWLCIPKLTEICWEALLFYFPDIYNYDIKKLMEIGIPKAFIERIS